jgi:CHAD domain-containing protein
LTIPHQQQQCFILPKIKARNQLFYLFSEDFQVEHLPQLKERHTFFDTFDWLLFQKGLMLYRRDRTYYIGEISNQKNIHQITVRHDKSIKFSRDFPKSALQTTLSLITGERALLSLFSWELRIIPFSLLNEDDKSVVKGQIKSITLITKKNRVRLQDMICLQPIRGYTEEYQQALLAVSELALVILPEPSYLKALSQLKLQPGKYSSKIDITLDPTQSAREASIRLLKQFLWIVKQNEKGIINDIDIEFLHDYRVAIRRTRSLLSQVKDIFPGKQSERLRQRVGDLQRKTNRLRDLDVYLLKKKDYAKVLPTLLAKGIEPLFQELSLEREYELTKVIETIRDQDTKQLLREWNTFLNNPESNKNPNSNIPVNVYSRRIIKDRLDRVLKRGKKLLNSTPKDEALHRLRIDCKKLRYLLEFFSSLYDSEGIIVLVKQLKSLQNLLGEYNDYTVQIEDLQNRLNKISSSGKKEVELAAAFGGLLTYFQQAQKDLRKNFKGVFEKFSEQTHLDIYHRLFF